MNRNKLNYGEDFICITHITIGIVLGNSVALKWLHLGNELKEEGKKY